MALYSTQSNRWTTLDDWYQKSNLTLTPTLLSTQVIHLTNHPRSLSKTQVNRAQVIPFSHSIPPEHHVEVYDDMDFYTVLLKDLLQLRSQTHPHPLNPHEAHRSFSSSSQVKLKIDSTAMQMKKKKRIIPRTTKGRKVRYEVHSKLQNFMTPQVSTSSSSSSSSGKWTETRIQEVFSTLFGRKSSLPALSNLSESFSPSMGFNSVPLFSTMEQEENERFPLFAIQ
ncbi:hypothetical protein HMI55_006214 [Coelomomyces lativittatus]|nr:hypothetical protein HMI56_005562 [Coelomomyces lativittatus]KAJ1517717.1 hypothetical protein HMI55_006214 [Coelomomyces lativittatus]